MKKYKQSVILFFAFVLILSNKPLYSTEQILFTIYRSKDLDVVQYELNRGNGHSINLKNPVNVYWVRKTQNNKREPLTYLQETFSYGIIYTKKNERNVKFYLAALPERILEVKSNSANTFKAYTIINHIESELESIYIQFDGGSFLKPKIGYVKLMGKNVKNKKPVVEIITQ